MNRGSLAPPALASSFRVRIEASGPLRVVLVVEDDDPIAELLTGAINEEPGYVAMRVARGTDAMQALSAVNADLVLMDIGLPGMSGLEVLDQMRDDERLRNVPVVFQTGTAPGHAKDMRARGIAAYVKKPFDLNDIVTYVKKLAPLRPRRRPSS